jgi:hypothetical protein
VRGRYGQLFDRQPFFYVTPGASNNPAPVPVAINEWLASNTRTLPNPGNGNRYDDWLEAVQLRPHCHRPAGVLPSPMTGQ